MFLRITLSEWDYQGNQVHREFLLSPAHISAIKILDADDGQGGKMCTCFVYYAYAVPEHQHCGFIEVRDPASVAKLLALEAK